MSSIKTIIWLCLGVLACSFNPHQFVMERISFDMHSRTANKGLSTSLKGAIFYSMDGKMITRYHEPEEMVIINDRKGDLKIYNVKSNELFQQQNYLYSTESNELYYFLENNKSDLGLKAMGFNLHNTRFEESLRISTWAPPQQLAKEISHVELVHEKANPIFLGYYDKDNRALKKTYFYNYAQVGQLQIPAAITKVTFKSPVDSIVTKATYNNFKLNREVKEQDLKFDIPADAKIINR